MEKRRLTVTATVVGVAVAVVVGSFVTLGADDGPRMEFGGGNVTVSDGSGEEVTVVEVSEDGTESYVVRRRAAEFEVRVYDGGRDEDRGGGDENGTVTGTITGNVSEYRVERVEEDAVRVIASTEMEAESLNETNGTVHFEVEDGGERVEGGR
jgi:hypothetical protein